MDISETQNPYASTSEIRVAPESITFQGTITEEHFRSLLPKTELRLFVALALLLLAIVLPILIVALFFAIFVDGKPEEIIGAFCMTLLSIVAIVFCMLMLSTRRRARKYLTKFPDLLGAMKGTFSSHGLILEDNGKTHWFPWVQLSHLVVSKVGVRVPLGDDPRRFLALADDLFDAYRPSDMEQLRLRNRVGQSTYDQVAIESAAAFHTEIGAPSYYCGWFSMNTKWSTWVMWLVGPVGFVLYILYLLFQNEWDLVQISLVVLFVLGMLPSVRPLFQLFRNRGRSEVMCWGWLSDTDLIYGSGLHVMKIQIDSVKYIVRNTEFLQFVLGSGLSLHVFRSLFQDKGHFDKLHASLERLNG